jgi:proteasome alpha subunit
VAEVGHDPSGDQLFHILYDGTLIDETGWAVLGGEADLIRERMTSAWTEGGTLGAALQAAVSALAGPDRELPASELEVAVLGRDNGRRTFHRIEDDEVAALLAG